MSRLLVAAGGWKLESKLRIKDVKAERARASLATELCADHAEERGPQVHLRVQDATNSYATLALFTSAPTRSRSFRWAPIVAVRSKVDSR